MRIFVTGATGVIGRRAVPLLVQAGHEVTAIGRTPEKVRFLDGLGARGVTVDLFDLPALTRAVRGAEVICNLATAVPPADIRILLRRSWRPMDRIRTLASAHIANAAIESGTVRRVVQESFAPVYAAGGDAWLDESSPVRPAPYNRSILDAEASAARFAEAKGVAVVLRFGMFYGPGDPFTRQLVASIRSGLYPLFGPPEGYSSWLAHEDAARAVLAALDVSAGTYNVIENEPMRRRDLANGLAERLGVQPPRFFPAWVASLGGAVGRTMARSLRISNAKFRNASGWSPRYRTALEGLGGIIDAGSGGASAPEGRGRRVGRTPSNR